MTERRVGLDVSTATATSTGSGMQAGTGRGEADANLAEQFRQKLSQPAGEAAPVNAAARPFDLFSSVGSMASPAETPEARARRDRVVGEAVDRLLVSDGSSGDAEVRIKFSDDLLRGTEARLSIRQGRLEIDFIAIDGDSAEWLAAQGERVARELSSRLRKEVRVRVRDGDDADAEVLTDCSVLEAEGLPAGPESLFGRRDGEEGKP